MSRIVGFLFVACIAGQAATTLVAPFSNHSKDPNLDWVGESISERIREALAVAHLDTVPREERVNAALRLSLRPTAPMTVASVVKLAEATEAGLIVLGQFDLAPAKAPSASQGTVRVTTRLFDRKTVRQTAEFLESGALEDLTSVQTRIAWKVLEALGGAGPKTREQFLSRQPVVKISALENYIRGLMSSNAEVRHRFFTQAARIDESFPHPCFYLGKMHFEKDNYREAARWLQKVGRVEPFQLESDFLLGISMYEVGEFEGALIAFERFGAALDVPEGRNNLGAVLLRLDRPDAIDHLRKALERSPGDPDYLFNVGYALWKRGEFEAAAERFRAVLDREREDADAILLLGRCLKRAGPRPGDARGQGLERLKDSWEEKQASP